MSHHLDSLFARRDVQVSLTDLYSFRGETDTVLAVIPFHAITGDVDIYSHRPEGMTS